MIIECAPMGTWRSEYLRFTKKLLCAGLLLMLSVYGYLILRKSSMSRVLSYHFSDKETEAGRG